LLHVKRHLWFVVNVSERFSSAFLGRLSALMSTANVLKRDLLGNWPIGVILYHLTRSSLHVIN